MTDLPAPLVPADVDLKDFPFMPVELRRLLTSETWMMGTGDEKAAAMTLWLESWHQVPAGSLPDNDRMLGVLSQAGASWKRAKTAALRGWVKCADGRLYHKVVCEKALEAWLEKLTQRRTSGAGNAKRWGVAFDSTDMDAAIAVSMELLRTLNPHSRALSRRPPKTSHGDPDGSPNGMPEGTKNHPTRNPADVFRESQGKGREEKGREKENNPAAQQLTAARRDRSDLDRIEGLCRQAAGLENEASPELLNLSPILALLEKGYDLDRDVLPVLKARAASGKRGRSWRFYVSAIEENRAANRGIQPKPNGANGHHPPVDWASRERFLAGRNPPLIEWGDPWTWPEAERRRPGFAWWFEANGGPA